jgi:hypothetical protein
MRQGMGKMRRCLQKDRVPGEQRLGSKKKGRSRSARVFLSPGWRPRNECGPGAPGVELLLFLFVFKLGQLVVQILEELPVRSLPFLFSLTLDTITPHAGWLSWFSRLAHFALSINRLS